MCQGSFNCVLALFKEVSRKFNPIKPGGPPEEGGIKYELIEKLIGELKLKNMNF